MLQQYGGAANDGEAEAKALRAIPRRVLQLHEFLKDHCLLICGDAEAGIPYLDFHRSAAPAAAEQNAAGSRVSKGVRQQIAQDPFQHHGIAVHQQTTFNNTPIKTAILRRWSEFVAEMVEKLGQIHRLLATVTTPASTSRRCRAVHSEGALRLPTMDFAFAGQIACIAGGDSAAVTQHRERGDQQTQAHGSAGAGHDWRPRGNAFSHDRRPARGRVLPRRWLTSSTFSRRNLMVSRSMRCVVRQ